MPKILVIDDDGIVRDALKVFLTRAGHEVVTAADGGNGVLAFKNFRPDLVILDRNLPVMSGSKVFDRIRELSAETPILILSGYNDPEEVDAYLRFGAASFLSKGDGLSVVLDEAERLLGTGSSAKNCGRENRGIVLIADDDEQTRNIMKRFLTAFGCEIIEARDGPSAVAMALEKRPDIILLDIDMPGKNGLEVLKELAPRLADSGFLMITGNEDEDVARECLNSGAFDYISKPINLNALGEIIKTRLLLHKK